MRKRLLLLLLIVGTVLPDVLGQPEKIERTFSWSADKKLEMNLKFAEEILIEGWDKNEVEFKASVEIAGGLGNEYHEINFEETGNRVIVWSNLEDRNWKNLRYADCEKEQMFWSGDHGRVCMEVYYSIKVPRSALIELETITGDIEIKGFSGDIRAKSISGFVDLSWNQQTGATLAMKTVTGELYSNLDIDFTTPRKEAPYVGYEMKGLIAGGGPRINLQSVSNDIFLRRKN